MEVISWTCNQCTWFRQRLNFIEVPVSVRHGGIVKSTPVAVVTSSPLMCRHRNPVDFVYLCDHCVSLRLGQFLQKRRALLRKCQLRGEDDLPGPVTRLSAPEACIWIIWNAMPVPLVCHHRDPMDSIHSCDHCVSLRLGQFLQNPISTVEKVSISRRRRLTWPSVPSLYTWSMHPNYLNYLKCYACSISMSSSRSNGWYLLLWPLHFVAVGAISTKSMITLEKVLAS